MWLGRLVRTLVIARMGDGLQTSKPTSKKTENKINSAFHLLGYRQIMYRPPWMGFKEKVPSSSRCNPIWHV